MHFSMCETSSVHFVHVPKVGAISRLCHNRHIHFGEGLSIHAILNKGHSLGEPLCWQFKYQLVMDLEDRPEPWTLNHTDNETGQCQLENIGSGSLNRRIQCTALGKAARSPILRANARQIATPPEESLRVLPARCCLSRLLLPAGQIRITGF